MVKDHSYSEKGRKEILKGKINRKWNEMFYVTTHSTWDVTYMLLISKHIITAENTKHIIFLHQVCTSLTGPNGAVAM